MKPDRLWFHRGDFLDCVYRLFTRFWLFFLILVLCFPAIAATPRFDFTLEDIRHPVFSIRSAGIKLIGAPSPSLEINLGEVAIGKQTWHGLRLRCNPVHIDRESMNCNTGTLQIGERSLTMIFRLSLQHKQFVLEIRPASNKSKEKWRLEVNWQASKWQGVLQVVNGEGKFLADLLPQGDDRIQVHQAILNGNIRLSGNNASVSALSARLGISKLSFSDASGLHAGEGVDLQLDADAQQKRNDWQWRGKITWPEGEIFWQPFYFSGEGHQLTARGTVKDERINITQGEFNLAGTGKADFSAVAGIADQSLQQAWLSARDLELSALFGSIIRPLAVDTALAETEAAGQVNIDWRYQGNDNQELIVGLQDASLTDAHGRFAVERLNAHIPWNSNEKRDGSIRFSNAQMVGIPLGETYIPIGTDGMRFSIPRAEIPVLDGKMLIENFVASMQASGWQWQFDGLLAPISMEKLTESLHIQPMFGTLSGTIPRMSYANSIMTMDGELVFGIFDGVAVARNLALSGPLSLTPHLTMDMAMYHIDLDLLTRAYSFGNMQGRVDVEIDDLELINWEPVKFDAKLASSAGDYKRRISQAAIKNLIALGGGLAVTAIQKSFLGLFEQFGYAEIGWSCKLRGSVCNMGGIGPATHDGGYMLIKGSGIPAITITGYNRKVDWPELLERLRHAIESGNPIIH